MILAKLRGGLSNQMFQYAAARRLAAVHTTSVRVDTSWYDDIPAGAFCRDGRRPLALGEAPLVMHDHRAQLTRYRDPAGGRECLSDVVRCEVPKGGLIHEPGFGPKRQDEHHVR